MKKQNRLLLVGVLLLILFVTVSWLTFRQSRNAIEKGYLDSEGNAAENFAVLTASNIHLSNEQVAVLKAYSYEELMNSEENNNLKQMMSNDSFAMKVDYAYVMIHLKKEDVKYEVTDELKDRYNAEVGTKLDIMWLLDVNVSQDAGVQTYDEYNRYSYYIEEDKAIFGEAPIHLFHSSEWGDHICGYAPLYTTEGTYIGVVGVELQTGDYDAYCGNAIRAMGMLLSVSLLTLSFLFSFLYRQYRRSQYEKVYTDALTGVFNRSYYNNRFRKHMNSKHTGEYFALVITDIDFFKKVNDTFGHDVGDEALVDLGKILKEIFGKNHVARFGGEEFVCGFWIQTKEELENRMNELFAKIAEYRFSEQEISLTVSSGCCYYKTDALDGWLMSSMLKSADCKLYESKENGRNQYRIELFDKDKTYTKNKG